MAFIYSNFLMDLFDTCNVNLANISKSSYSNVIRSIGFCKLKTTSTQKILVDEFDNFLKLCQLKDGIIHIAALMEAASELRMLNRH